MAFHLRPVSITATITAAAALSAVLLAENSRLPRPSATPDDPADARVQDPPADDRQLTADEMAEAAERAIAAPVGDGAVQKGAGALRAGGSKSQWGEVSLGAGGRGGGGAATVPAAESIDPFGEKSGSGGGGSLGSGGGGGGGRSALGGTGSSGAGFTSGDATTASGTTGGGGVAGGGVAGGGSSGGQPDSFGSGGSGEGSSPAPTIFVCSLYLDDFVAYVDSQGLPFNRVFYQGSGETNGEFDEQKYRAALATYDDYDGHLVIDFEDPWFDYIYDEYPPESPEFAEGEAAVLQLISIAREVLPDAKLGFYGVPGLPFWVPEAEGWPRTWDLASEEAKAAQKLKWSRVKPVIDACDFVCPNVYDYYLNDEYPGKKEAQQAFVHARTSFGLELGEGKPVMPIVWHRNHNAHPTNGYQLLDHEEFEDQIVPALAAGASGVIWWGADRYWAKNGVLQEAVPEEFEGIDVEDWEAVKAYLVELHIGILDNMLETLENVQSGELAYDVE